MQIERILVAIDYSVHSRRAFAYAVGLGRRFGATLVLVHVWERPAYLPEGLVVGPPGEKQRTVAELIHANAQREMDQFLSDCEVCDGVVTDVVLETGEPAAAILRVAEARDCDVMVLGAQGNTGVLHHLILGSVTDKVVRMATVPVVTVPDPQLRSHRSLERSRPGTLLGAGRGSSPD